MRRPLVLLATLVLAAQLLADDLPGPEVYLKILTESKLHYNLGIEPVKTPAKAFDCPRRFANLRLVDGKLVDWTVKPEAQARLDEAEALYDEKKYAEAGAKYKAATEADPEAVTGYLYYGDTLLFGAKDPAAALVQYRKATALDPTIPEAHYFAATALVQLGKPDEAREEIVNALTYYPGYESLWKVADAGASQWNARPILRHKFDIPATYLGTRNGDTIDVSIGEDGRWAGYALCKAVWANEAQFQKTHPAGKGGWSLEEERACVANQLMSAYNMTEGRLEKEKKAKGEEHPVIVAQDVIGALPPLERHLWDVSEAHLLDGYIVFEIVGQHCPLAMSMLDEHSRSVVQDYIRKYVIVAK